VARNLYRFYLYIVYIAFLIFVAVAIGSLLNTLLAFTPLRGGYGATTPDAQSVVQAIVFAVFASTIAGVLAVLHYWLIRRDIRNDPAAGASAIRSFFLNITEAFGIALAVPMFGFFVLNTLATSPQQGVVSSVAFALPTLALVVLLALERRRTQAGVGTALTFQRLHFYGVQILLLIFLTISWQTAIRPLIDALFFASKGLLASCGGGYCPPTVNPLLLIISVLWFVCFWLGYGWLVRKDTSPLLRLILHCLSLAYGIGFALYGLYQAFQVLFLFLFGSAPALSDVIGPSGAHDFFSPLTLGILIIGVYYLWLRLAARQGLIEHGVLTLTEYAIAAILSAAAFCWGAGYIIYNLLQAWVPVPTGPAASDWATALALLVAGLGYIPLGLYLRRRNSKEPVTGADPQRGFVLALCGGGLIALAIGMAVALYAGVTALFRSPIANWQLVAHSGLAAGIIGAILVAIYLPIALREHLFSGAPKLVPAEDTTLTVPVSSSTPDVPAAVASVPVAPVTLEAILDELLAGKIARDEAATRIRALNQA
jgi:hypothetical protein